MGFNLPFKEFFGIFLWKMEMDVILWKLAGPGRIYQFKHE